MHEWFFRSTLDHLVWIIGMVTAYNFPRMDGFLARLEQLEPRRQLAIKAGLVAGTLLVSAFYVKVYYLREKRDYNAVHPYTSWLPITLYLVLRNINATSRQYANPRAQQRGPELSRHRRH